MSIAYISRGVRYQEVWFDEPVDSDQDIIIGYQRPSCPPGVTGSAFHTLVVDLVQSPDQILLGFGKDTRYEVRRAERSDNLSFEFIAQPKAYVKEFCKFYGLFSLEKGLPRVEPSRLIRVLEAGHLVLSRILSEGDVLVWHAYYCVAGRARLLHSASQFRGQVPAQRSLTGRANRYLHWCDMLALKEAGYRLYDLGGWSPPEVGDPEKQRINAFKEGFGGRLAVEYNVTYPGTRKGWTALHLRRLKSKWVRFPSSRPVTPTAAKKPHICFVAADIWPILVDDRKFAIAGGLEVQLSILARAFVRAGFPVSVVTMNFGQPDGVVVDGITVYRAHKPNEGVPVLRFFHPRVTSWWAGMQRADADVYIQRSAAYLTAIVGLFCHYQGRSFIYSGAHDLDFKRDETWKLFRRRMGWRDRKMFEWGLRWAHGIVSQHQGQLLACRRWYGREAVEIPNCYPLVAGEQGKPDGVILWAATLKSWKRPELFLELARQLPSLRFRMVGGPGKGSEANVYEDIKQAAGALPNLEFVGFVPYAEIGKEFNEARLFVNTSDYEGFPNTFLQAWARQVPTVSFIDCAARETARPIGFVCRDMEEMIRVISRLSKSDVEWQDEGRRARNYFESRHSVDAAVALYSRLIENVVESGGKSSRRSAAIDG